MTGGQGVIVGAISAWYLLGLWRNAQGLIHDGLPPVMDNAPPSRRAFYLSFMFFALLLWPVVVLYEKLHGKELDEYVSNMPDEVLPPGLVARRLMEEELDKAHAEYEKAIEEISAEIDAEFVDERHCAKCDAKIEEATALLSFHDTNVTEEDVEKWKYDRFGGYCEGCAEALNTVLEDFHERS